MTRSALTSHILHTQQTHSKHTVCVGLKVKLSFCCWTNTSTLSLLTCCFSLPQVKKTRRGLKKKKNKNKFWAVNSKIRVEQSCYDSSYDTEADISSSSVSFISSSSSSSSSSSVNHHEGSLIFSKPQWPAEDSCSGPKCRADPKDTFPPCTQQRRSNSLNLCVANRVY